MLSSAFTRSSASRLPGHAASTVMWMALNWGSEETCRMSAADFSRSGLTYSWKKNLPCGAVWASSSMENDELFDTCGNIS